MINLGFIAGFASPKWGIAFCYAGRSLLRIPDARSIRPTNVAQPAESVIPRPVRHLSHIRLARSVGPDLGPRQKADKLGLTTCAGLRQNGLELFAHGLLG